MLNKSYSQETIKAINEARDATVTVAWEAEQKVLQAILVDANLTPVDKATEITRSMGRYNCINNLYIGAENIFTPNPWGGYPVTAPIQPVAARNVSKDAVVVLTDGAEVAYTITCTVVGGQVNTCMVSSDDTILATMGVTGVINSREDGDGIGIAVSNIVNVFEHKEVVNAIFNVLLEAFGMVELAPMLSYAVRTQTMGETLYIDMANNEDLDEVENFSDIVRGRTGVHVEFDTLFATAV